MSGDGAHLRDGLLRAVRHPLRAGQASRWALDAFAARYARRHGLSYAESGETPGGSLFLGGVELDRSHSFLRGPVGGGPEGLMFFVETAVDVRKGLYQGWTMARLAVPEARELAAGLACGPRLSPAWGGRVVLASTLPDELARTRIGDATFDERHEIGIQDRSDELAVRELFTDAFMEWLDGLDWGRHGERMLRFELRRDVLCVWLRDKQSTESALDGFAGLVRHVAEHVRSVPLPAGHGERFTA